MKSLKWLLDRMLADASIRCDTDTQRDIQTISRRIECEGDSFVTITLPRFAEGLEKALEHGTVASKDVQECWRPFGPYKRRNEYKGHEDRHKLHAGVWSIPKLFRGMTTQIFDPMSGVLLEDPNIEAIKSIRQVSLAFKKVLLPCSEQRVGKAFAQYLRVENELDGLIEKIDRRDPKALDDFERLSGILWSEVLGDISFRIWNHDLVPKHGPGATAERISGNQKYNLKQWHTRLQEYFPFDMYGIPSPCIIEGREIWSKVEFVEPDAEPPVRVITVPKTLKTPRIIAIEPVCNQYIQQALMEAFVEKLESKPGAFLGHVNFTDQGVNRELAQLGSKGANLATMDLSEASDRVHKSLVYLMLSSAPAVRDAVFACRSTTAMLPSGVTVPLSKFASMGSALCFPMEAMVFFTLCVLGRLVARNTPITPKNARKAAEGVYVYGDDLIVPKGEVSVIAACLEYFGLKVNSSKTFEKGLFRESCGMDAYAGEQVTPVYVRHVPPCDKRDVQALVSHVSLGNQLYLSGFWKTARHVRSTVESILGTLPTVRDTSPVLGWVTAGSGYSIERWNEDLHRYEVRGWIPNSKDQPDPLEGPGALQKYFLKRGSHPIEGRHLERSVRPGSVNIKYRWGLPF